MNAYDRAKKMVLEEQGKQKIIYCVRNVVGPTETYKSVSSSVK